MSQMTQSTDAAAYRDAKDELSGLDSLADTPWSELFHEARTNGHAEGVAVPVKVDDAEIVTGDVVTTQQGEHFHVRNTDWDGTVTMRTKGFMSVDEAVSFIRSDLQQLAQEVSR